MPSRRWLPVAFALLAGAPRLGAQDVEMLGRRYGTVPPPGYFRELARDPEAFRFTRGRAARGRVLEAQRALAGGPAGATATGAPPSVMGPRGEPVEGTFRVPVVLGLFSDSPVSPYSAANVQLAYFDAPSGTVTEYYDEVSLGKVTLRGDARDWARTTMTQSAVTQNESSLVCCGIGNFIKQVLALQSGLDWGAYDNDGPDGVPNSGDDDGYVDALAVIHPTRGAECGGAGSTGRIWAHKWSLSAASGSGPYATSSPRTGGGAILVDDYFVQGVLACDGSSLNEIGVFTHETGHAFGLPDLYDTRPSTPRHNGAGNWDLMATGTWGCNGSSAARPCHMGAWSKAMLGWVTVTTLPAGTDLGTLTLPPVETSAVVYRVDAGDGSAEYFLLENRQRLGYDQALFDEGLLVWQIDAVALASRWLSNTVNASSHMAVWLRQADGCDDLGRTGPPPLGCDTAGLRGDPGDPFPGVSLNTAFHAGSNPASISFPGTATGVTVLGITPAGDDMRFRLLTRFARLTVTSTGTSPGATGLFTVDGATVAAPPANVIVSAPFARRQLEAAAGEPLAPGERKPFLGWSDAPSEPRVRSVITPIDDAVYEASYGGTQYELGMDLVGGVNGVAPGTIESTPAAADLWFTPGADVGLRAVAQNGFSFLSWSGALLGHPNPTSVTMDAPKAAGASFQLIYAVADVLLPISAAVEQDVQLTATSGTAPLTWSVQTGALPTGLVLTGTGRLIGAPLDVGTFPLGIRAVDALGLSASATLTLQIAEPTLSIGQLASQFLLSGPALGPTELAFLDRQGNRVPGYDLGDFRAWVLAHPSLPLSAALPAAAAGRGTVTLELPLRPDARSEGR